MLRHALGFLALCTLAACGSAKSPVLPSASRFAILPIPRTRGPEACQLLAKSRALRQLPAALEQLPDPSQRKYVDQVITASAHDLQAAASVGTGHLSSDLNGAARALQEVRTDRSPNRQLIASISSALEALGNGVQPTCIFPLK
jgi:hypothetical protein